MRCYGANHEAWCRRKYISFTIVDIKAAASAGDLIVFEMLHDLASAEGPHGTLALAGLYYTYIAPVIPPKIYVYLQRKITLVISALEGTRRFPRWLGVPAMYRAGILHALRRWQSDVADAFSVHDIRTLVDKARCQDEMRLLMNGPPRPSVAEHCEYEDRIYRDSNILMLRRNESGHAFIAADVWKEFAEYEKK